MALIFETTDYPSHDCCQQYCSAYPTPPFFFPNGRCAVAGVAPGTGTHTIQAASPSHPVTYSHHWVMIDLGGLWDEVIEAAGEIIIELTTGYALLAGSRLRWVHLCLLDDNEGCSSIKELGQSDDRNITLVSNTKYEIPIYNDKGVPGTYATLPSGSGTQVLMFVFVFSGPQAQGYLIPIVSAGQVVLSAWTLTTGLTALTMMHHGLYAGGQGHG